MPSSLDFLLGEGLAIMRIRPLIGLMMLAAFVGTASAQEKKPETWVSSGELATAKSSDISVPMKAGNLTNFALRDLKGDGADMAAQYETPDGKIIGTIFLYAPTRPDAGLTFLATDETIRRRFGESARRIEDELVTVGGVAAAGRRVVYTGMADEKLSGDTDGRIYSTAAFVRAGAWMMKVRVSGPISRSKEIGQNLDALLNGLKFGKQGRPIPQIKLAIDDCPTAQDRPSINIAHPASADALAFALSLDPDVQAREGAVANPLTTEITGMCREGVEVRDSIAVQTFRVTSASNGLYQPRRVMLYGDAGIMLLAFEDMKHPGQYFISRHSIGQSFLFGRTSSLPNEAELRSLLFNPDGQPAVITISNDHLTNAVTVNVNCNFTEEGCPKAEQKPQASSR